MLPSFVTHTAPPNDEARNAARLSHCPAFGVHADACALTSGRTAAALVGAGVIEAETAVETTTTRAAQTAAGCQAIFFSLKRQYPSNALGLAFL